MTINYPLFNKDFADKGKNFKIIYRVSNCQDYDAQFLSCSWDAPVAKTSEDFIIDILKEGDVFQVGEKIYVTSNSELELVNTSEKTASPDILSELEDVYIKFGDSFYYVAMEASLGQNLYYPVTIGDGFNGIRLYAHEGRLQTSSGAVISHYIENEYMELEFDICPKDTDSSHKVKRNYLKSWMDGIPDGILIYGSAMSLSSKSAMINIGSELCDVDVYLLKAYETVLTDEEHLNHFILDAPNAAEIGARYHRNDIIDSKTKQIDWKKFVQNNPNCLVHLYDIDKMTTQKTEIVPINTYIQYQGDVENPKVPQIDKIITATKDFYPNMKVQGTSSEAYVAAAANLDVDFGPTLEWKMSETAKAINFACTKVNVASCEHGNNALNQEWYNIFQPYQSIARCKELRDTMEFTNGVIFIRDRNDQGYPELDHFYRV